MAFDVKAFLENAVIPAAAINAGGYAFQYIDPMVSPYYNTLNTTSMPTASKWAKVATYTGAGLALQAVADSFLSEGSMMTKLVDGASYFLYGLSGATIAADPTYIIPKAGAPTRMISSQPASVSTMSSAPVRSISTAIM